MSLEKKNFEKKKDEEIKAKCVESLKKHQVKIEKKIQENLSFFGVSGTLRDACEYALCNSGRRFRPSLVFMIASALGHNNDVSDAALSIECFHTASLIADDLPCMDDDDERRNKPSLHKAFTEATALLASYTLIAAGNAFIAANAYKVPSNGFYLGILALENAARNTGAYGATGGQFLDIYPPTLTKDTLRDVIHKKTVSLFEIAFIFGWLFGGGDPKDLELVKKASSHFGMAFQIADDFGDVKQDDLNESKINTVGLLGYDNAKELFWEELAGYRNTLKVLHLDSEELLGLADYLEISV